MAIDIVHLRPRSAFASQQQRFNKLRNWPRPHRARRFCLLSPSLEHCFRPVERVVLTTVNPRWPLTEEHLSNYQKVPAPSGAHIRQPITRLGQPFILDFARHVNQKITLRSQSQDKPRAGTMYLPLRYGPKRQPRIGYYQDGIALCRFERSTLPEHAGKRMVVMRYVKILRPVKLVSWSSQLRRVNASLPVEGELCEKHGRVWAKDVDADTQEARTFRGLYEADEQESTQS